MQLPFFPPLKQLTRYYLYLAIELEIESPKEYCLLSGIHESDIPEAYSDTFQSEVDRRKAKTEQHKKIRAKTTSAYLRGDIEKKPCEECGNTPSEIHHLENDNEEYEVFLIQWLCEHHHWKKHFNTGVPDAMGVSELPKLNLPFITRQKKSTP